MQIEIHQGMEQQHQKSYTRTYLHKVEGGILISMPHSYSLAAVKQKPGCYEYSDWQPPHQKPFQVVIMGSVDAPAKENFRLKAVEYFPESPAATT